MATIRKRGDRYQVQVRREGCKGISKTFYQLKDAQVWARQAEAQADRDDLGANLSILKQTTLAALVVRYRDEVVPSKKGGRDETIVLNAFLRQRSAVPKIAFRCHNPVGIAPFVRLLAVRPLNGAALRLKDPRMQTWFL